MDSPTFTDTLAAILHSTAFVILYFIIGFGPGLITGILLANRLTASDKQLRVDKHIDNIRKAGEHNSQWHPENPRWKS